ncbi:TonB-dependent receptor [Sphingobacterium sp.]|uniref:TonB-dependent receptor n=1 Tax=Sphingobacterium sp. TaxID=341027 RepID=UPI0028AF101C|nr:TonB-dependent receptor [Sphingobacterium sp.]
MNYFIKCKDYLFGNRMAEPSFAPLISKKMKATLFLGLLFTYGAYGKTEAQQVTLNVNKGNLKTIFQEIKKQTGYHFFYDESLFNDLKQVNVNVYNQKLESVLKELSDELPLEFEMHKNHIIVLPNAAKDKVPAQQQYSIKGRLLAAKDGAPIENATISINGSNSRTSSDSKGNFTLKSFQAEGNLTISHLSFKQQTVRFNSANANGLTISMEENDSALEEAIVVGYGTQKRINLTGAVDNVSGEVLKNRPINNVAQGLQGAIPNLTITPSSGNPASNPGINVRGTTSINGGGPLVLVDGVEMNMNLVNPNDIANVTVLKDASSAAIYGVRGAFGVILITTKSAANVDKTMVSYNNNFGFSQPSIFPEIVKKNYEHADYINQAMLNAGLAPMYDDATIAGMKAWTADPANNPSYEVVGGNYRFYGYNDWQNMLMKDFAFSQRHNISLSGGTEKTKFFSSVGYNNQTGLLKINSDQFKRLNTRLSVENQTTDWLKLGLRALYNHTDNDEPYNYGNSIWHQFVFTSPVRPYQWNGDPAYPQYDKYNGMYFDDQNPIPLLEKGGRNHSMNEDIWTSINADLKFMPGWTGHIDFNYNLNIDKNTAHRKKVDMIKSNFVPTEGNSTNNSYSIEDNRRDYYSFNAYTQYEKTLGKHYFKAMVGYNQELTKYGSNKGTRLGILNQEQPTLSLGSGEQRVEQTGYEWALRGGFFRLNYIYADKYLLEVNGRYDGTSRFPKDNRFVFLPSVSAGWRVSEENFMHWSRPVLSNLKLRGSYGELGNQLLTSSSWSGNTRYYPFVPFMSAGISSNYIFGNQTQVIVNPPTLVSNSLTWEKVGTFNLGADLAFFNNKLDASFDWYQRTTSDMLTSVVYPELLGASSPVENKAELRTKGWELALSWKDKVNEKLSYSLGFNLGDSQAKITKFDNPTRSLTNYYVGQKIGEIWGYTTEGFFADADDVANHADQSRLGSNWAAGDIKYLERDHVQKNGRDEISPGDNTVDNPGDRSIIGNTTPRYTYGFNGGINYANFSLDLFVQGVGKRDFWPTGQAFWPVATQYFATQQWWVDDTWSPKHTDAYFPRAVARSTKNQQTQTKYLQDASYLRLKNVTLGYSFHPNILRKLKLSNAQVFLSGENLFFFSPIKGSYDPEAAAGNGAMIYPFSRTYSFGITLTY